MTDLHVTIDPALLPIETVLPRPGTVALCAPHALYRELRLDDKIVVSIWNFWGVNQGIAATQA
jgi:hypothetical protein